MSGDDKVQALLALVEKKRKEIKSIEKPDWKTNCQFSFTPDLPQRVNLQTVSVMPELVRILSFLSLTKEHWDKICEKHSLKIPFNWMGYTYNEWENDICNRFNKIELTKKKADLQKIETSLNTLISPELRRELELKAIEQELLGES